MAYLDELKNFVKLHIRSQADDAAAWEAVLDRIESDCGDGPGGWAYEWTARAAEHERAGNELDAIQCYNFARFPFADSDARKQAHEACVRRFERWAVARNGRVQRIEIPSMGERVPVYALLKDGGPLLLVIGGVVSIKEQWHRMLFGFPRLGFSVVLAECPGVGENPLRFSHGAHAFLGDILNHFGEKAAETYVVGMSFGGYLAMRQAVDDGRIRGITAPGAPAARFFTDRAWLRSIPATTRRTLCRVCRTADHELENYMAGFALTAEQARALTIPVHYVFSSRDEIIPAAERQFLEQAVPNLRLTVFDDIHGAANHMPELRKYIPWSVMAQSRGRRSAMTALLLLGLRLAGARRKVSAAAGRAAIRIRTRKARA